MSELELRHREEFLRGIGISQTDRSSRPQRSHLVVVARSDVPIRRNYGRNPVLDAASYDHYNV